MEDDSADRSDRRPKAGRSAPAGEQIKLPSRGVLRVAIVAAILVVLAVILHVATDGEAFGVADETPVALSYLSIFLLIAGDAVVPILPGETTLNAASTAAAAGGDLELPLVIMAGALGAIVGDSALFFLARRNRRRVQPQIEQARGNARVSSALNYLGDNHKVLLVFARYVPGLRFVVNATFGLSDMPYRDFLPWSALGAVTWATYTCLLAYWVGSTIEDYPLASVIISSAITTTLISILFLRERRRRQKRVAETQSAG